MSSSYYSSVPISLFPIDNYNQQVSNWIPPSTADYQKPLVSSQYQKKRAAEFYARSFGSLSAWSSKYIQNLLDESPSIQTLEEQYISTYSNINKTPNELGYDENFRLHSKKWIKEIANNMRLEQLTPPLQFNATKRGICINNVDIRALPTDDVHFYNFTLPGQGYPFDNLRVSSAWAGTATYTVAETIDKAWSLVITHFGTGWVKSEYIAKVDENFLETWQNYAEINLAAITQTKIPVIDEYGIFRFSAYIGGVFPVFSKSTDSIQILIPVADKKNLATINNANLSKEQSALMPLAATPESFANLMQQLVGRPYGWGNLYLLNDCSAELKSLFTPFGIWLARHSSDQAASGKTVDKSSSCLEERIDYLINFGHKLMTIVYIGSHVFLYIGNDDNENQEKTAMSYQNIWGLSPADHSYRQVVGGAVFLPILKSYPENLDLSSLADKTYFVLSYLDEWPTQQTPQNNSNSLIKRSKSLENVF